MALQQFYVHGVIAGPEPCYWANARGAQRLHTLALAQSELDGSCGVVCVLQAAMVLCGLPRTSVVALATTREPMLRRLWQLAHLRYFHGTTPADLVECVGAFAPRLTARVRRVRSNRWTASLVRTSIDGGAVPIVGFAGARFSHWALIVGLELDAESSGSTLLLLDPGFPEPAMGIYNARLQLDIELVQYVKPGQTPTAVRLSEIVLVQRVD